MEVWKDFFVAIVGAAAALAGLIFVGVSINLTKILSIRSMPGRAAESLALLIHVLIISALFLVPGQSLNLLATEVLVIGIVICIVVFRMDRAILKGSSPEFKVFSIRNMILSQLAILPYVTAGILMLTYGENGVYFIVAGIIISFIKSVIDAWVLLVEINR
jgi:modulator of FtsH protease